MDTVLITGANRGLGLELAGQYTAEGWRVFACSRRPAAALDELAASHRDVTVFPLDVAEHPQIARLANSLAREQIDVLINNAGRYGRVGFSGGGIEAQAFGNTDYDDWELTFRVNVLGPMKMAESFIEQVAGSRQKKLVTLTSMLGSMELNTIGGLYAYRASKAAVNSIMKSMSVDLAKKGVLAVAIHPGWAQTDMGGPNADIDAVTAVRGIRHVIENLEPDQLGKVIAYDGEVLPY